MKRISSLLLPSSKACAHAYAFALVSIAREALNAGEVSSLIRNTTHAREGGKGMREGSRQAYARAHLLPHQVSRLEIRVAGLDKVVQSQIAYA